MVFSTSAEEKSNSEAGKAELPCPVTSALGLEGREVPRCCSKCSIQGFHGQALNVGGEDPDPEQWQGLARLLAETHPGFGRQLAPTGQGISLGPFGQATLLPMLHDTWNGNKGIPHEILASNSDPISRVSTNM